MVKKIIKLAHKIDLQLDSDTEYFGNGNKFQVGIRNRKKNRLVPVLKDANKLTVTALLQTTRNWKRAQREKQARREARLKK
jgi:hypothetical protein